MDRLWKLLALAGLVALFALAWKVGDGVSDSADAAASGPTVGVPLVKGITAPGDERAHWYVAPVRFSLHRIVNNDRD